MNASDIILELSNSRDLEKVQSPEWFVQLTESVNDLIKYDFKRLVQLLYRLDVSEKKIRDSLSANEGEDAAKLIATLFLERQIEKIKTRQSFKTFNPEEDEDLRW
jgi:hypothetical protein